MYVGVYEYMYEGILWEMRLSELSHHAKYHVRKLATLAQLATRRS